MDNALFPFIAAFLCAGLGIGALCKESRALVSRAFALGMLVLALREVCAGLEMLSASPMPAWHWQLLRWTFTTMLPGSWLLFSLSFGRRDARQLVRRWRWGVVGALTLPALAMMFFASAMVDAPIVRQGAVHAILPLRWPGYGLCLFALLGAVLVLVNLEGVLRGSTGSKRQQVKFMLLGVGSVFAVYVYSMSQTLLFAAVSKATLGINSWSVLLADLLIIVSLLRHRLGSTQIAVSQTTLYNSLTVLLVGVYLVAVGVLAKIINVLGNSAMLPLGALFVFGTLLGLTAILLSDTLRYKVKRALSRHVYKARHDYRHVWTVFARRTASVVEPGELCRVVVQLVAETFTVPAVTLWLWPADGQGEAQLGASTMFADDQRHPPGFTPRAFAALVDYLREQQRPVDFAAPLDARSRERRAAFADGLRQARIRYAVALMAGQKCLGLITLHERVTGEDVTLEDQHLLKIIADQAATNLLNLQLMQRLSRAQQKEAFQNMSAFFVHDLKNLASKLSMTLQTLPVHYDNPEFREDMLHLIEDSVAKIHRMCERLSLLSQGLKLQCAETDLNQLIRHTLGGLQSTLTASLVADLGVLPPLQVDSDQIDKVLVNLVLNAQDALHEEGEIRVSTALHNDWAEMAVSDNGCGMSREFISHSLFQAFRTTKRRGLGIGLFQCKTIVEAHHGRIEVESEEGKGSTFRVLLPCLPS